MSNYRIEGVATVLASIAHGGDKAGTMQLLRREKIAQPDGAVVEVPIVSGNALRGILRDHSARLLWHALGEPELSLPVFHVLWSGGALAKAGAGHVLTSQQLAELRRLVPHVSLFGASGGGRIIEGKLDVGKLIPIVAETRHIVPPELVTGGERSIWDHLQVEDFTRQDDAKRATLAPAIEGARRKELTGGGTATLTATLTDIEPVTEPERDGPAQQMRYGVETIAAGTRLYWWMGLRGVTDLEAETLRAALSSWAAEGAHVGGRSATGHGRLALDAGQWVTAHPQTTTGTDLAVDDGPQRLHDHVAGHRDRILETLGWLA